MPLGCQNTTIIMKNIYRFCEDNVTQNSKNKILESDH